MFFYGLPHMDTPVLADLQGLTYISSMQTQDAFWKICHEQCIVGKDSARESQGTPCYQRYLWLLLWWWWLIQVWGRRWNQLKRHKPEEYITTERQRHRHKVFWTLKCLTSIITFGGWPGIRVIGSWEKIIING